MKIHDVFFPNIRPMTELLDSKGIEKGGCV